MPPRRGWTIALQVERSRLWSFPAATAAEVALKDIASHLNGPCPVCTQRLLNQAHRQNSLRALFSNVETIGLVLRGSNEAFLHTSSASSPASLAASARTYRRARSRTPSLANPPAP